MDCEGVAVVILFERHQFNYSYVWIFVIGTLFANWYLVVCFSIQGITFELDEEMAANDDDREALQDIINNTKLSEGYLTLARDIEVMEPKSPEDIYKVWAFDLYNS